MSDYTDLNPTQRNTWRIILATCQSELDKIAYAAILMDNPDAPDLRLISIALQKVIESCFAPMEIKPRWPPRWRVFIWGGAVALIIATAIAGGLAYNAGKARGEVAGELLSRVPVAAMAGGPQAAAAWAGLIKNNDLMAGLAACQGKVRLAPDGKQYCLMHIRLDAAPSPFIPPISSVPPKR